ncbi:TonB-dependent receptor [Ferruginibacter sp.]|uniref:TonB-dependent receptor n=1 Tax=Ferruginibacter sp. TaxID=1940288 RepID=UPI0026593DE5|nr:TonB-dependent receptor [Ferruginibacter sp.]
MKKNSCFIPFLFFVCCITSEAAFCQIKVSGRIMDAGTMQPLGYAAIADLGSNGASTSSDQSGNFILFLKNINDSLAVSLVGYKSQHVHTGSQANITIELEHAVLNLKDIVVLQNNSVTKFSTLSKIDLDLKPVRNTQELLRLVPGLFVAQHAGGGKAEQIFLRGFDCDHGTDVQVSVDGLPANMVSHAHGQGYADAHFIIPETINNIDFGTGPYYADHGNLNTAGYVAFSTFNNIANSRIQVEAGRFNTYRALAMLDLIKKDKIRQSGYIVCEVNYTNGPTINPQHFKRYNIFGKYNLALSDRTQLTANVSSFASGWNASGQVPERAVANGLIDRFGSIDASEGGQTQRYNASLLLIHHFTNGAYWQNQLFYSRYLFDLYSDFTFYLNDPVKGDEINQGERRNLAGYQTKLNHQYQLGKFSLKSTYGAGVRYDVTQDSKLTHVVKRVFLSNIQLGNIKETNGFAFTQQQFSEGKWLLDAGLRADYFHFYYFNKLSNLQQPGQSKMTLSPKINIQYTATAALQLYVKTGKGFHSNDTRVVVANNGKEILPAAYGTDLGIIIKPNKKLLFNIAAWYLKLNQEFVYVGDDGNIEPAGKTLRKGVDVIARYQLANNIFANVNVNFTKPRALGLDKGANYIPLAPTATSTGGLYYKASKGFNGSISYRYIKNRPANEDNSIIAKGYFLADASINYTKPTYEIGLAIENMLNAQWNEAQFATTSRLQNETAATTELNFTPGTPFFARLKLAVFF